MFEKRYSIELEKLAACTDACSSMLKRIKYLPDGSFLILENTYNAFTVRQVKPEEGIKESWTISEPEGLLVDYLLINGRLYAYFVNSVSEYDENLTVYRSDISGTMRKAACLPRESYQHDMDYFHMFSTGEECHLLLIRHNRLHLYKVGDTLKEIRVLEGQKWFISGSYAVNSMGRDWELYDSSLELLNVFKFEEDVDWLGIEASKDGNLIVMATDNGANEIGGLYIFDKISGDYKVHYQRYGFFHASVCGGKVWASVISMYSDIGGLMIFDKNASLKFAHLRDETEGDSIRAYQPAPVIYQALSIDELPEGKVLLSDNDKIIVTDITCRALKEFPQPGYDCCALGEGGRSLAFLHLENRLYGGDPEQKYPAHIDVYSWNMDRKRARIVDFASFRKFD